MEQFFIELSPNKTVGVIKTKLLGIEFYITSGGGYVTAAYPRIQAKKASWFLFDRGEGSRKPRFPGGSWACRLVRWDGRSVSQRAVHPKSSAVETSLSPGSSVWSCI